MWSKFKYFRSIAAGCALILLAILLIIGYKYLKDPAHLPITTVKVDGKLKYLQREQLQAIIEPHLNHSFFLVDVQSIQQALSQEPWMAHSSVRRVWPDSVWVQVEEHEPFAYWGKEGLVSQERAYFRPESLPELGLPRLSGPEDQLTVVLGMYNTLSKMLDNQQVQLTGLQLNARRAWQADLSNGMHVQLGSIEAVDRFERFLDSYPLTLSENPEGVSYVDLRYTNGFVIARKTGNEPKEQPDG